MTDYNLKAGISDLDYHRDTTSLSSTGARKLLACPARFKWERDHPPSPTTRAFDFGKLAHKLVLGEGSDIIVVDAENWLSKAAKETRAAAYLMGSVPVLTSEYDAALAMRESVMAHPVARELFSHGSAELSGYWDDAATGIRLRFRPDWMTGMDGRTICVDLKTTTSADPAEFVRSAAKYGYFAQASWYRAGLVAHGVANPWMLFVAVEKTPPYPVSVIELDDEALAYGDAMMRRAIDLYAYCMEVDEWPSYGNGVSTISLPRWLSRDAENHAAQQLIAELEGIA